MAIGKGSTVVLRTKNAIYSTCKIVAMSDENVTVTYFTGMNKDRETGEYYIEDRPVETIPRKKIVSMSERL